MVSLRRLGTISRTYRHLARYQQVIRILFKYGFSDLIDHLHIEKYLETGLRMINRQPRPQVDRLSRPERLRMALEEMGPTFIKLGQLLSTRPDLIPPEYLNELTKLQDKVPPFAYSMLCEIVRDETNRLPEQLFAAFDAEPLAAASISQVHRARLDNGEEVVVKVRRPAIERIIAVDLEILAHLAQLMEQYLEELQGHKPLAVVNEFARSLSREIDFTLELSSIQRFTRQFQGNPDIYVPRVYPELSSERILVMEWIDGIKSSDVKRLGSNDYDLPLIARRGAYLMMEQIFVHGFFHADPHPGNLFILPGNVICFIDFGQMGRLSLGDREDFTNMVQALVGGNERKVTSALLTITTHQKEVDLEALSRDLAQMMDLYLYRPLAELELARILQDILGLVSRHELALKPAMYVMLKALSTVEGVGLMLDPRLELITLAKPFMRRIKTDRLKPGRLAAEFSDISRAYMELAADFPENLQAILTQLRQGRTTLIFEVKGVADLGKILDRMSNRISFSIVLAALIIGSSLVVLSDIPPRWNDIPIIGIIGFLVAGIMGFWLLLSIIRHGRM
ncbi:MAG: ABC transporter [Deltaproteobacteria bacterium]|nr:MAG: ABC transporter [Deltaproteobacteria bacterium]